MKEVILEEQFGGGNTETINKPNYKCLMVGTGTKTENKTTVKSISKPKPKKPTKPKQPTKSKSKPKQQKYKSSNSLADLINSVSIKTQPKPSKQSTKSKPKSKPKQKSKQKSKPQKKMLKGGKLSKKGQEGLQLGVESLPLVRLWWNVADGTYAKSAQDLLTRFRAWRNNRSLAQMDDTFDTDPEYTSVDKPYIQDPLETAEGADPGGAAWARYVPEENIAQGQLVNNSIDEVADQNLLKAPTRLAPAPVRPGGPAQSNAAADAGEDAAGDAAADAGEDIAGDTAGDIAGDIAEDLLAFGKGKMTEAKKKAVIKKMILKGLTKHMKGSGNFWQDLSEAGDWIGDRIIDFVGQPYFAIKALESSPQMRVQGQAVKPNLSAQRQAQQQQNEQQNLIATGKKKSYRKK